MLKIKTILLWLKGLENLEDESVIEKFPAFSQHFKKKKHKSIRNSVVCLFGVLCKLYYTLSTITTTKIRTNNRYLNRLKEKIWKINDKTPKNHFVNSNIYSVKSSHVKNQSRACFFGFWSNFFFNAQRFDGNKKLHPTLFIHIVGRKVRVNSTPKMAPFSTNKCSLITNIIY